MPLGFVVYFSVMKVFGTICVLLLIGLLSCVLFVLSESWDACRGKIECIEENASEGSSIPLGENTYFLSSIYNDKRNSKYGTNQVRNELFVANKKTNEIEQLTSSKSHISALAYSPQLALIVFAQAQAIDPIFGYIPTMNSPGKFRDFRLFSLDLSADVKTISLLNPMSFSEIHRMGFDKTGKKLIFQTIYGSQSIQFLHLETHEMEEIVPDSKLFWWHPKTPTIYSIEKIDSERNEVYFNALDGYVSAEDRSFVYNMYKMNLDTKSVVKLTHHPAYRGARVIPDNEPVNSPPVRVQ